MARSNGERHPRLAGEIKRQLPSEATIRFAQAMPAFQAAHDLPSHMRKLLDKLECAETGAGQNLR